MQILHVKTAVDFDNVTPSPGTVLLWPEIADDGTVILHTKDSEGRSGTIGGDRAIMQIYNFIQDYHSLILGFDNSPVMSVPSDESETPEFPFQAIVIGDGNSYGSSVYVRGNGNSNTLGFVTVIGHNNKTYQFQTFIGDNNDFQAAVNLMAIGNGNKGDSNAYGSLVIGDLNTINARYALVNGYRNTVAARGARVFGRYLTIDNNPANEYGFFIGDGKLVGNQPQGIPSFIHRVNKAVLNPLYNPSLDPGNTGTDSNGERKYIPKMAFTTQYQGRLTGTTRTVDPASGPVVLDHDFYNRWKITPTAAVIPELENWLDGDEGELIVYNGGSYIQWPSGWVWENGSIPALGSVNLFRLYKLDNTIYITEGF